MDHFSAKQRSSIVNEMKQINFDLLVIGGGITGAGITLDATARGLKVALVDMQDFAGGTSGRSTKLIHGGLRYLKQLELGLVAEVGRERAIVLRNAPHITKPELMLLPIVQNGSLGKFSAKIGMWIYEKLARVKKEEWHKVLTAEETAVVEPLLKKNNLLGGIQFYEYRTDDARLTIEVLKEAVNRGALAINYMKVQSFLYNEKKVAGALIEDQLKHEKLEIHAKYIINATGPWVDELDDLDLAHLEHKLHASKGVHLVVSGHKFPVKQSIYFDAPDKRMIFVIPREGKVYIGTTDTFYSGDIQHPMILNEDCAYLLDCVNNFFSSGKLSSGDIESGWAGVRPLIHKPGKGHSEISRKDEIFESSSGLIAIAGGKLTGYRKMAERAVNRIAKHVKDLTGKELPPCSTENIALSGGKIPGPLRFSDFLQDQTSKCLELGLSISEAETLVNRYGSNTYKILHTIKQLKNTEADHVLPLMLRAQLHYAINNEMCVSPADFFIRRISALYFDIDTVKTYASPLLIYMRNILDWDDSSTEKFALELQKNIEEVKNIH